MSDPMDPVDREVAVFSAARRLPAPKRAAYLDGACAGDVSLRQRVESLLRAGEQAGELEFLQGPAPGAQRPADTLASSNPLPDIVAGEKVGSLIGRYKLLQQIGEGGCGVVYMAEQEEPVRRQVALKVIKLGMDTKQVIARFEAERQALALMDHPNIAKVLEAGATDTGRPYFVMELVRGIKITRYCDENSLSTRERLDLFIKVAQAVQHAHQKGIIHRDIKPSNVLVADHDGAPVPKIIDFGIAKATTDQRLTDKTLFTAFEQFMGTPAYMSPEQARMSGLDIDTRTDIYSLGVLLYELLTGQTPFDAEDLMAAGLDEMRRTISEHEPARPSTRLGAMLEAELTTIAKHRHTDALKLVHLVRGDLDWIVMKALEKDGARRYATANGLAADIQRHLNIEAVVARPPSNLYRFHKLIRRHRLAFAAMSIVTATLIIGFAVSTWLFIQEKRALRVATRAESKAEQAQQQTTAQLYESYLAQARANRLSRRPGRRFGSIETIRKAVAIRPSSELRDEAIAALALLDLRVAKQWELSQTTKSEGILFDSKVERYAVETDGGVRVCQVKDDQELSVVPCGNLGLDWLINFSVDSRYLAMTTRKTQDCIWDVARGEWAFEHLSGGFLAFNPQGGSFACANRNGTISLYDLDSRQQTRRIEARAAGPGCFDPEGSLLACFNAQNSSVEVWDLENGKRTVTALMPTQCNALAWSADGRLLGVGCNDNCAYVLDGHSGARVAELKGHQMRVMRLAFNHAGSLLATLSWDGTIRLWDPIRGLQALVFQDVAGIQMQFSEDDRHLAHFTRQSGKDFGVLEVAASPVYRRLPISDPHGDVGGLDLSPDGRLIVAGGRERICFLDFASGREIGFVVHPRCISVLFHPDGNSLLTSGHLGLTRWPFERVQRDQAEEVRIGLPRPLQPDVAAIPMWVISQSATGRALAAIDQNSRLRAVVWNASDPTNLISLTHPGAGSVAISPNGEWVATGTWKNRDVKIWEAATGRLEQTLDFPDSELVLFSPDGQWLITAGEKMNYQLWEVGSWQRKFSIPPGPGVPMFGAMAFSPDSRLLAIGRTSDDIRLLEAKTGRPIAKLEAPDRFVISRLCFSHDGTQLLALDKVNNIHVWDLRELRLFLKSMNLDWDLPAYPADGEAHRLQPFRFELITADGKP